MQNRISQRALSAGSCSREHSKKMGFSRFHSGFLAQIRKQRLSKKIPNTIFSVDLLISDMRAKISPGETRDCTH